MVVYTPAALALAFLATGCFIPDDYSHQNEEAALSGKSDQPLATKDWTFLVYGAADNNLAAFIAADLNELESVGSSEQVNFLAFLDTPQGASRHYLKRDDDLFNLTSPMVTLGEVDSGSPESLEDFISWGIAEFPARNYAVVVSGHGGGVPRVIAPDAASGNAMRPADLLAALSRIPSDTGERLGLVGADACMIQTIEFAYELRDVTAGMVGSENTEPGEGWPYARIADELTADPAMDPTELGNRIARAYADAQPQHGDYTIANIGMKGFSGQEQGIRFADELSELATLLTSRLHSSASLKMSVRAAVHAAFRVRGGGLTGAEHDAYGDLDRFLFGLEDVEDPDIRDLIEQVRSHKFAIHNRVFLGLEADKRGARGISIYLPLDGTVSLADIDGYRQSCEFCATSSWADLVEAYAL